MSINVQHNLNILDLALLVIKYRITIAGNKPQILY